MSTVSSKFYVSAIDDGVTLHGSLQSTKSLTQAWTGTAAVPNWISNDPSNPNPNSPVIYLTLLEGSAYVLPESNYTWRYNGNIIDFNNSTLFEQVTNYQPSGYSANVPAIRIKGNLASSQNVDVDLITFSGTYRIGDDYVDFAATINVRITSVQSNGVFGLINFANNISTFTEHPQTITVDGALYDGSGNPILPVSSYTVDFYLNDTTAGNKIGTQDATHPNVSITDENVVDIANLIAVFSYPKDGSTLTYIAYETIDDQKDPEMMYIQFNGANGNAASLKKNESVEFNIWMGTNTNPTAEAGWTFKVKILDSMGNVNMDSLASINPPDANGWRSLDKTGNVATCTISYSVAKSLGKYITGLVLAEKTNS